MTMLDLDQEPNQRTHHVLRAMAEVSEDTLLVSKVRSLRTSLGALVSDSLRWTVTERREGTVRVLRVHPLLNYAQAVAAGLVQGDMLQPPKWHRRMLATILSVCGMARDVFLVPAFVLAVLSRDDGVFDICVAENPWTGVAGLLLKGLKRVRFVVYDDMDHVAGGQMLMLRRAYVAALERFAIRRANLVVSAGWLLGEHRRKTTGRDVLVIPNGVDPQRFKAALARRPHPPTLVYVGNLSHYAGVDLAIDALPIMREALPAVRLLVVGDGDVPYFNGLRKLAQLRGVADCVEFRGRIAYDDVPAVLAESDIGLATFRDTPLGRFAFPLKVVEYMAAGLPVLCTLGSEGEEILRRYPAGRAITFSPEAFAVAATDFLTRPEIYARAQAAGLEAAQVFTWEHAMKQERDAALALLGVGGTRAEALPTSGRIPPDRS